MFFTTEFCLSSNSSSCNLLMFSFLFSTWTLISCNWTSKSSSWQSFYWFLFFIDKLMSLVHPYRRLRFWTPRKIVWITMTLFLSLWIILRYFILLNAFFFEFKNIFRSVWQISSFFKLSIFLYDLDPVTRAWFLRLQKASLTHCIYNLLANINAFLNNRSSDLFSKAYDLIFLQAIVTQSSLLIMAIFSILLIFLAF